VDAREEDVPRRYLKAFGCHKLRLEKEIAVPGDPKECRQHAARCMELAGDSRDPKLKETLQDLARNWTKLAIQLETSHALHDLIEPKKPT